MMKKKTTKKKTPTRKRSAKRKPEPRPYILPKTAAEFGISCFTKVEGEKCGKDAIWFDYQLGEKEFYSGFVCDEHKVSNRIEKLARPHRAKAAV